MASLVAHQKQYVLGPSAVRIRPDWVITPIDDGLILSHCPRLAVQRLRSRDDRHYWLIGLAAPADAIVESLAAAFSARDSSEIEMWTGNWAGKWLLISPERCWPDASSSLAVNYRMVGGDLWLSNSPALLSDRLPGVPSLPRIPWQVTAAKGMDWIPAPLTTRDGIRMLLPQRTIDPRDGSIRPVRMARPNRDLSNAFETLADALRIVMVNWGRSAFAEKLVGLTAGLDTRTLLAAACAAKIDIRSHTISFPFMSRRDRMLPPRLAATVGVPHAFRTLAPVDDADAKARAAVIAEHMDGATSHPSFDHLARFQRGRDGDRDRTSANGTCFEVGRCYFWNRFTRAGLSDRRPTADQILQAFAHESSWRPVPLDSWRDAMHAWVESLSDPVPLAHDWRDRFYLDQRLGAWNANTQRTADLVESTTFNPANCLWLFDLLLQPDAAKRRQGAAQREAIRILEPRLLKYPINPRPLSDRLTQGAKSMLGPHLRSKLRSLKQLITGDQPR